MRERRLLEQVWTWLLPVLNEDVLFQDVAQGLLINGRSATQGTLTTLLLSSFHNVHTELRAVQTTADAFTLHLQFNGRHCGHFAGIPATGRQVMLALILRFGVKNGRIYHIQLDYDAGELLYQLGLTMKQGDDT